LSISSSKMADNNKTQQSRPYSVKPELAGKDALIIGTRKGPGGYENYSELLWAENSETDVDNTVREAIAEGVSIRRVYREVSASKICSLAETVQCGSIPEDKHRAKGMQFPLANLSNLRLDELILQPKSK